MIRQIEARIAELESAVTQLATALTATTEMVGTLAKHLRDHLVEQPTAEPDAADWWKGSRYEDESEHRLRA